MSATNRNSTDWIKISDGWTLKKIEKRERLGDKNNIRLWSFNIGRGDVVRDSRGKPKYITLIIQYPTSVKDSDRQPFTRYLMKRLGCKGKLRMGSIYLFGDHVTRLEKNLDKWWEDFSTPSQVDDCDQGIELSDGEYESSGEFVDAMGVPIDFESPSI